MTCGCSPKRAASPPPRPESTGDGRRTPRSGLFGAVAMLMNSSPVGTIQVKMLVRKACRRLPCHPQCRLPDALRMSTAPNQPRPSPGNGERWQSLCLQCRACGGESGELALPSPRTQLRKSRLAPARASFLKGAIITGTVSGNPGGFSVVSLRIHYEGAFSKAHGSVLNSCTRTLAAIRSNPQGHSPISHPAAPSSSRPPRAPSAPSACSSLAARS